ncbi:hypothetical protein SAMN04487770_15018 [Butyrivibrio sp. ob235]|uniref:hypothetical protein n=1 Tax=Butyrivibrio sp. ob235 TaxID=1761780 RepID=UPI0008ADEE5B|nr:hypothetical protein [Butyrivibrio sp. ob235]SEM59257.1 hypothetical protein SAMN04487770_15018 [Butyrivibrio sp. ob235]
MRYIYFWSYRGLPLTMQEDINNIIVNHDYKKFKKIQFILEELQNILKHEKYFPVFPQSIVDTEKDCDIPLNEQNFNLIDYAECEHG